jgi:hypothetical protein
MHEGVESRSHDESTRYRDLMDPTPPEPGERRVDSDGVLWVWALSHHSVAEELDIQSSNGDYWPKRLEMNSLDAAREAQGEKFVVDPRVENSAFAQPAYRWQQVR